MLNNCVLMRGIFVEHHTECIVHIHSLSPQCPSLSISHRETERSSHLPRVTEQRSRTPALAPLLFSTAFLLKRHLGKTGSKTIRTYSHRVGQSWAASELGSADAEPGEVGTHTGETGRPLITLCLL